MKDHYALSPDTEAAIATEEYRDAVQAAQDAGHHGLAAGDFTGYAESFHALQDAAHTAIYACRVTNLAAIAGTRLRVLR